MVLRHVKWHDLGETYKRQVKTTATEAALAHASGYELRNAFVNGIDSRSPFLRLLANRFCECTLA
jgi:hypothetical protein